eukprot:COSAG04_NODE_1078_length_8422_cov_5.090833_1_plen_64_part_10
MTPRGASAVIAQLRGEVRQLRLSEQAALLRAEMSAQPRGGGGGGGGGGGVQRLDSAAAAAARAA